MLPGITANDITGQPFAAMEYAEKKGGLVPESCLPYLKSEGGPMGTCDDEPCLKFQKTPKCPKDILHRNPECADGSGKRWSDVALPLMSQHILQLSTPMATCRSYPCNLTPVEPSI